jgi:hypothetical protein
VTNIPDPTGPGGADPAGAGAPHDIPSAGELLEAVAEFLTEQVVPGTGGRLSFHARVAANVVSMVAREMDLGADQAAAHAARLADLGLETETELAQAIRAGRFDDRPGEVRAAVRASVADKLAVANPAYLGS